MNRQTRYTISGERFRLFTTVVVVLAVIVAAVVNAMTGWSGLVIWLLIQSIVTLFYFGYDKQQAQRGGWRVPERALHGMSLLGGFAGAWLGMVLFRHKTRKPIFRWMMVLSAVLWAGVWWWLRL